MVNIYKNTRDAAEKYGKKGDFVAGANIGAATIASSVYTSIVFHAFISVWYISVFYIGCLAAVFRAEREKNGLLKKLLCCTKI